MNSKEKFISIYGREPDGKTFCPYRICPLGAHSDHNLGKILGFAINYGVHFSFGVKQNGIVEVSSLQFSKRAQWHVSSVPKKKENDWADYLRGATLSLSKRHPLTLGLCGVIEGDLPIGGLSSSASVTISFLCALCKVNGIVLSDSELIEIALEAENKYVGVSCGKLDQSCEILSRKNCLLFLDTKDDSYELIPEPVNTKPYEFVIFFSGVERTLVGSKFNMRVDELRSAAYALKAFSGMEYGKFEETFCRDVPFEVYQKHKRCLPEPWAKRAEHWFTEFERVHKGVEAWKNGQIEEFGKLVFESGASSINNYETGSPELKKLYEIMTQTDGIYGGRFSGAGFKGCCIAIIDPSLKEDIFKSVQKKYLAEFPLLENKYCACVAKSIDGVGASINQ